MSNLADIVGTVHHVSFRVDDLKKSLDFYEHALGFERLPRPDAIPVPGAWLRAGDVEVHLIEKPVSDDTGTPPSMINALANHVAFKVNDLEQVENFLTKKGFLVQRGPVPSIPQAFVQDPSGNLIEFSPVA